MPSGAGVRADYAAFYTLVHSAAVLLIEIDSILAIGPTAPACALPRPGPPWRPAALRAKGQGEVHATQRWLDLNAAGSLELDRGRAKRTGGKEGKVHATQRRLDLNTAGSFRARSEPIEIKGTETRTQLVYLDVDGNEDAEREVVCVAH